MTVVHRLLNLLRKAPPAVPPVIGEAYIADMRQKLDRLHEKHSTVVDESRTLSEDILATMEGLLRHYEPPKDGTEGGTSSRIAR